MSAPVSRVQGTIAMLAVASLAHAGIMNDEDGDTVPDAFDNCVDEPNGPMEGSNQVDFDLDGYGNVCDCDYNNDGAGDAADFFIFLTEFVDPIPGLPRQTDANGDDHTTILDFMAFIDCLVPPMGEPQLGPSGLVCAGVVPCIP